MLSPQAAPLPQKPERKLADILPFPALDCARNPRNTKHNAPKHGKGKMLQFPARQQQPPEEDLLLRLAATLGRNILEMSDEARQEGAALLLADMLERFGRAGAEAIVAYMERAS